MGKILVVDDAAIALTIVTRMIEKQGHTVVTANDGEAGIAKVKTDRPDVVVTDLLMPKIDGLEFLSAVKQFDATIPVIVLTANIQDSVRQRCIAAGASAFLKKPPSLEELHEAIGRVT